MKSIFLMLCCILLSQGVMSQPSSVYINFKGENLHFGVVVKGVGEVILDDSGTVVKIINTDSYSGEGVDVNYYSNFNNYETGKIKSVGGVTFTYYSNFRDYEAGKVKSIGDIKLTYYSKFNDYEAGKIKTISGVNVKYYSKFNDYESCKVKSVGSVNLNYYSNFHSYESGKIKSIGRHKYEYESGLGDFSSGGQLKSGDTKVTVDGINFLVRGRRW